MKTKFLLIYAYIIPVLTSLIVSSLPWLFKFISYDELSAYFLKNSGVVFAFLAVMGAITLPFQFAIINEDNPHVLTVLGKTNVRGVFIRASIVQAVLILCSALLLLIFSAKKDPFYFDGYFELLALSMITFESIALISNGRAYGNIREKIITATNRAINRNSFHKK